MTWSAFLGLGIASFLSGIFGYVLTVRLLPKTLHSRFALALRVELDEDIDGLDTP